MTRYRTPKRKSETGEWKTRKAQHAPDDVIARAKAGPLVAVAAGYEWPGAEEVRWWFNDHRWTVQNEQGYAPSRVGSITASLNVNWRLTYLCLKSSGKFFIYPAKKLHFHPWWHWNMNYRGIRDGLPDQVVKDIDELYTFLHLTPDQLAID